MNALAQDALALWRARALVAVLTRREVAARHAGTAAGILWPYLQPLLTVAAYYLVFDVVFRMQLDAHAPTRALGSFLIVGALPWMAFCDAASRGMNSLIEAGGVLQKNPLPPVLFPVRAALASAVIFGPLLLLMAAIYLPLTRLLPGLGVLLPLFALQLLLCVMLGYLLAILAAALRDIVQIVGFLLSIGIYLSPILFPLSLFPENWRWVLWLNPMTGFVLGYQAVLLSGGVPPAGSWFSGLAWIAVVTLVLSVVVRRSRDQLVDWL